ncbi:MAG: hypothetical protein P8Y39_10230, partial [Nitrospirota bacterium]
SAFLHHPMTAMGRASRMLIGDEPEMGEADMIAQSLSMGWLSPNPSILHTRQPAVPNSLPKA